MKSIMISLDKERDLKQFRDNTYVKNDLLINNYGEGFILLQIVEL